MLFCSVVRLVQMWFSLVVRSVQMWFILVVRSVQMWFISVQLFFSSVVNLAWKTPPFPQVQLELLKYKGPQVKAALIKGSSFDGDKHSTAPGIQRTYSSR